MPAQSSTPQPPLLLWKLYEGLGDGSGGVSKQELAVPSQRSHVQCHVMLVLAAFPVHVCAVTQGAAGIHLCR